jgi:hypothetical protein
MPDLTYFKRFRMELRLGRRVGWPALPEGYEWIPWSDDALDVHAEINHHSFEGEPDAAVFPNLASATGCRLLMRSIRESNGFCPAATWLAGSADGCVGTIQGILDHRRRGAVQNLGVLPEYRGRGIGRALVLKALRGFLAAGASRVYLEVTAGNEPAVRLYHGIGFRTVRTLYRGAPRAKLGAGY